VHFKYKTICTRRRHRRHSNAFSPPPQNNNYYHQQRRSSSSSLQQHQQQRVSYVTAPPPPPSPPPQEPSGDDDDDDELPPAVPEVTSLPTRRPHVSFVDDTELPPPPPPLVPVPHLRPTGNPIHSAAQKNHRHTVSMTMKSPVSPPLAMDSAAANERNRRGTDLQIDLGRISHPRALGPHHRLCQSALRAQSPVGHGRRRRQRARTPAAAASSALSPRASSRAAMPADIAAAGGTMFILTVHIPLINTIKKLRFNAERLGRRGARRHRRRAAQRQSAPGQLARCALSRQGRRAHAPRREPAARVVRAAER
jgi:hypothetical protein